MQEAVSDGVPQVFTSHENAATLSRLMVILSICSDPARSAARSEALQGGRFRVITARSLPEAWARSDGFDIAAVVLDHEFANDIGAAAFRQRYITLQLNEKTTEADLLLELSGLLDKNASTAVN